MRKVTAPKIIATTMTQDKHLMYFTQVVDVLPSLKGPTALSEANKKLSGREIHPVPVPPPTIRSFN